MTLFIYIFNFLLAFLSFLLNRNIVRNKPVTNKHLFTGITLLPLFVAIVADVGVSFMLFRDGFIIKSGEFITSFLLPYVTLNYFELKKERKTQELFIENLQTAKDHAEIEALKLQLDPHFLFNSLNTLNHLVGPQDIEARKYIQQLADVYRYILKNRTKELILLTEELSFSRQYFYLLSIRYGQAIQFNIQIDLVKADDYLVIPISIQILIENAIKHNRFTTEETLDLFVNVGNEYVTVRNKVRGIKKDDSLKIGLRNLSERSLIITNKPLVVDSSESQFTVHLPLIKYK